MMMMMMMMLMIMPFSILRTTLLAPALTQRLVESWVQEVGQVVVRMVESNSSGGCIAQEYIFFDKCNYFISNKTLLAKHEIGTATIS